MGSSRPTERSLGEATFLPQWMKDKLDTRFDYSDSSFSPPADDTFFYIRYPNYRRETVASAASNSKESLRAINEVLNNKSESGNRLINQSENSNYKNVNNIDFSKHPLPCQSFIPFIAENVKEPKIIVANKGKIKYQTTDDDFCDPKTSECGRSIVHVANQIMSSTSSKSNSSDSSCTTQNKSDSNLERVGTRYLRISVNLLILGKRKGMYRRVRSREYVRPISFYLFSLHALIGLQEPINKIMRFVIMELGRGDDTELSCFRATRSKSVLQQISSCLHRVLQIIYFNFYAC